MDSKSQRFDSPTLHAVSTKTLLQETPKKSDMNATTPFNERSVTTGASLERDW
jgi:hypothetical protein